MKPVYTCQACNHKTSSIHNAPSIRMGATAFHKAVCDECYNVILNRIDGYWASHGTKTKTYNCPCCERDLRQSEYCHAAIDRHGTGELHTQTICTGCFDEFLAHVNDKACAACTEN